MCSSIVVVLVAVVVACVAFRSARVSPDCCSDSRCSISVRKDRGAPGATVRISWIVSNRIITSQLHLYTIQGEFRSYEKNEWPSLSLDWMTVRYIAHFYRVRLTVRLVERSIDRCCDMLTAVRIITVSNNRSVWFGVMRIIHVFTLNSVRYSRETLSTSWLGRYLISLYVVSVLRETRIHCKHISVCIHYEIQTEPSTYMLYGGTVYKQRAEKRIGVSSGCGVQPSRESVILFVHWRRFAHSLLSSSKQAVYRFDV